MSRFLSCLGFLLLTSLSALAGVGGGPFVSGLLRGSIADENITGVARTADGDIVICGWTESAEVWDNAPGAFHQPLGSIDGFVAVLSPDLKVVRSFTFVGGEANDKPAGVVVTPNGDIVVAGTTESRALPTTTGAFSVLFSGYTDCFLASFSEDLRTLKSCTYFGGEKDEYISDVTVDEAGSVYICGGTTSQTKFPKVNAVEKANRGGMDAFLARLTPNLSIVGFSTYYGGSNKDVFNDIAIDEDGSIVAVGTTMSSDCPTYPKPDTTLWWRTVGHPYDYTFNGGESDALVAVFSSDGARCVGSTLFGGSGNDIGASCVIGDHSIFVFGTTSSPDIPIQTGPQAYLRGASDIFIISVEPALTSLMYSTYFGEGGAEVAVGSEVYGNGQFVLFGQSTSNNFPHTGIGSNAQQHGGRDPFISIGSINSVTFQTLIGGEKDDDLVKAVVEPNGGIVFVGSSTSQAIDIDNQVLIGNGVHPSTDGLALRLQTGEIDLLTPRGGERICIGKSFVVNWSALEMVQTDSYQIDYSLDNEHWFTLKSSISGNSATVTISDTNLIGKEILIRVVSTRMHSSVTESSMSAQRNGRILTGPRSETVCKGATVTLTVTAEGSSLTYQWRKNSTAIVGATTPALNLSQVTETTSGKYDVLVSASCGPLLTSAQAVVDVKTVPLVLSAPPDTTVHVNDNVVLRVVATGSDLEWVWFRNNVEIPGATTSVLHIADCQFENAGLYTCSITGSCGATQSRSFELQVAPAVSVSEENGPTFSLHPNPATDYLVVHSSVAPFTTVRIIDALGRTQLELTNTSGQSQVMLDVHKLAPGMYFISTDSGGTLSLLVSR